jgi:protein involved in polysaccharide export with SLBB domain
MFDRKQLKKSISCLAWALLSCAAAYSQQESRHRAAQPDIISDNLEKAAASADQILEVVNKEAGLMVEFKRLLAQDAGASGQILEESDLTDGAVADRLRSDLRARVLATRLLQRYGYLVPRLNPDSDLGAEQKLVRQERAQMLVDRSLPPSFPESRESLPVNPTAPAPAQAPRSSVPLQRAEDASPSQMTRPDGTGLSPDQHSGYPASLAGPETMLAAAQVDTNPSLSGTPHITGYRSGQNPSLPSSSPGDLQSLSQLDQLSSGAGMPRTGPGSPQYPAGRDSAPAGTAGAEQVRMVRRPNPYADVPSLYDLYVQAGASNRPLERFGLDVFRKGTTNPDYIPMDLPVGPSYVVGPGDSLSIDLWGGVSQRLLRTVDRQGRVALPEAGPVLVSGRTLGDVQEMVQRSLRTQFRDVSADVALLRLRSVRMYVVGDVTSPGAYDVSSLSTPLNALFVAGGVTSQGSLRRLQHYRGKQLVEEVDAYDLLLHGIRGDLQRIENGDSLMVPPLGPVVTVEGMVRRPAVYELRNEKTLVDVLDLAGGILPAAALRHIEVQRLVAHEKRTMMSIEISDTSDSEAVRAQMSEFEVQDGDEIHIFPIAPYNSESIYLVGHVLRPGRYSYKPEMRLTDLVTSYTDLLPEPSTRYAEIIRLHAPDYHPVVETFDLATALEHPDSAPKLEPLDTVHIFGRYDFEPDPEVLITGEVRAPGSYRTSGQQH